MACSCYNQPELANRGARVTEAVTDKCSNCIPNSRDSLIATEDFRGVRDDLGNLQAGAIVTAIDDSLYLDYIATDPWNLIPTLPNYCQGAASSLIKSIVRESLERGYNGRIIVDVTGSFGFYQKMGFVDTGRGSENIPEMVLTSAAAQKLIEENV